MATIDLRALSPERIVVDGGTILIRRAGSGPVVLLLHGYPETHLAWRKVVPALVDQFAVVAADLPGYGDSSLSNDTEPMSKRTMARMLADAMSGLGISQFAVVGHDRGARVAYRLALDMPQSVSGVAVLDVLPILEMADRLTYASARQMAHWFWLAQPSSVPEHLIGLDPDAYVRHIVDGWGGSQVIEADDMEEYLRCLRKPEVRRAVSAEYQADQLDLDHDRVDRSRGHRIGCPLLALWARGGLTEEFGEPMAIWRDWAEEVSGCGIAGGHFMMEESPQEVVALLTPFLSNLAHEGRHTARHRPCC